ncbi:hypothetical protein M885DRAFT_522096 [Pelagophyceae sp. CCMP2097]|nr:hypothetical protein M885DRAFT_522096 [Pelagophyceae sp. CCMP2097]
MAANGIGARGGPRRRGSREVRADAPRGLSMRLFLALIGASQTSGALTARRGFLHSATFHSATAVAAAAASPRGGALSLSEAAAIMRTRCDPALLRAFSKTSGALYRGSADVSTRVVDEPPDLLDAETQGAAAAKWFSDVDAALGAAPTPRRGHLATPDPDSAAQWGSVVAVYPLANPLDYAWIASEDLWWPRADADVQAFVDDLRFDALEAALVLGTREVLFEGPFLQVESGPKHDALRRLLSA